jgi:hypothetical protein
MSRASNRRAAGIVSCALALAFSLPFAVAGCGRRVVLDPDEVHRHNTEWIQRRPTDAGAPPAVPPRTI